ncbi:MAG: zinc ribbon domain-containing protein [Thermoleophilia bacterium]|nr:zinc ribbon domain-containing protein [Thermoleophilia bacterium]
MGSWFWDDWGWSGGISGLAVLSVIVGLAIYVVPLFFFLLNLRNLLEKVDVRNRAMAPENVWLNFIPIFNLGWFIYTVVKVRDSVRAEYQSRGWPGEGDFGYNVGLAAGVLLICSVVLGWVPVIGFGLSIAFLVCWVIYWLKTNDLRNRLGVGGVWPAGGGPAPYSRPGAPQGGAPYGSAPYSTGPPVRWSPPPAATPAAPPASPVPPAAPAGSGASPPASPSPASTTQSKRCGACGATILPGDRFCQSCGLPLPQSAQTPAAAAEMPPESASSTEDES